MPGPEPIIPELKLPILDPPRPPICGD